MDVSEYWDQHAKAYSEATRDPAFLAAYDTAISLSGIEGKQVRCILDVSCGNGMLLARAMKKTQAKLLIGVDFSAEMLRLAKENLKDAGACVSSKPLDVYRKLAALSKKARHDKAALDEYRKVYAEHTALKEQRQGRPLAILLKQDMHKLSFEINPVADAVFFMFPVFDIMDKTSMHTKELDALIKELTLWVTYLYNLGNALNYLRPGGNLVVMIPVATASGKKPTYDLHKTMYKGMEKLGCKIASFEPYESPRLAKILDRLYGYDDVHTLEFLAASFTRTPETAGTAAQRAEIVKKSKEALSLLRRTKKDMPVYMSTGKDGRMRMTDLGGLEVDIDEMILKIKRLFK